MSDLTDALDAAEAKAELPTPEAVIKEVAAMIQRSGIDLEDLRLAKLDRLNVWQGFYKDGDGEAHKVDQVGFQLSPKWETGPEWPVIQPGPAVKVSARQVRPRRITSWKECVVLPDIQGGFFHGPNGTLEPLHDEAALNVALAVIAEVQPDVLVLVGDNLDLAEFGRYRLTPAFQQTTQATIDWGTTFAARLRAVAPEAKIVWLAGNHEERMPSFILDNARPAFGLRRGAEPAGWPVLSVPHLLHFDDYGVEYLPGYPASNYWINERLRVIHGHKVKSGGSTAHGYLATEKTSVIYGHVHRREWAERTRQDHDGPRTIMAASPGCLARTDGAVPSTKGGTDLFGRPLATQEDWQQGLAVVHFEPGDGRFAYEQLAIHDGWCHWRGQDFVAEEEQA